MYWVRFEFTFQNERFHDFLGPFDDYYFAMLYCVQMGEVPYMHGITPVHVERAKILNEYEYAAQN